LASCKLSCTIVTLRTIVPSRLARTLLGEQPSRSTQGKRSPSGEPLPGIARTRDTTSVGAGVC
jgi:hypothetical protein